MASLSLLKRASALLFTKTRTSIQLRRNETTKSAKGPIVEVSENESNGITTISMSRPPVNSLNLEMCVELRKALENAVDKNSRGVILTSTLPVFSAGLDIMEMHRPEIKRCTEFWHALQDLWLTLYGLGIPAAAAINGASPAGGCLLALSCEYRVMAQGEHTIGLNETKLGIVAPKWFQDSMIAAIGYRQTELALMRGSLFKPQDALKIGLIDEIASDKNDTIAKCEKYISSYAKISREAREATKLSLRKKTLEWLEKNRDWDSTIFLNFVQLPQVQDGLDKYLQALKIKSSK
ncbi:enoyl-CoA delta isomerase 1, mitochondrial [Copidosoma floridanum]|uniref:enoyl-CoA delta isomerase 1, mitochondrial n=1 Tax=Copidosoma floridanum TaxID=29053 RepID=UPI0006C972D9|nr:enoyl-CoA delta isomerase 1, mitochondrial [Copidosoma floridanum]